MAGRNRAADRFEAGSAVPLFAWQRPPGSFCRFFLLALAALQVVTPSVAFHALAVGSMAGLIIGMMTRTALGHTGRPLKSGAAETAMYCLIQLGALARLCAAIGPGAAREACLVASGLAWSLAFSTYVAV